MKDVSKMLLGPDGVQKSSLNKYQGGHHTTVTIQFILIVLEYEHSWKESSHVE